MIKLSLNYLLCLILIGINFCANAQEVEIIGSLKVVNGSEGSGKLLTYDSTGLATWNEALKPINNVQIDDVSRQYSTSWGAGPIFSTVFGFRAGSKVKITYQVPTRNDDLNFGGAYIEPQVSFDDGTTWNSLGSTGYGGGVMVNDGVAIGSYTNTMLINPNLSSEFSVKIRMYYKAYTGFLRVNGFHDINEISDTAPLMSGINGGQHYTTVIIEEVF